MIPQMFTASQWLTAVYQEVHQGYVVLWRDDTCGSIFLPVGEYEKADAEVEKCKATPDANIYFGLGVQPAKQKGRGTEKTVCALPGVWVDIDYGDKETPAGNQKQYPPREIAEQALKDMPLKPSVVVKTGGGLHAYWLLDEPFLIKNEADRERFRELSHGWQALIKRTLSRLHPDIKNNPKAFYDVDPTADLARVLRLPCGWMHKYGEAATVEPQYAQPDEWDRYGIEDLEEFSIEVELPTQKELIAVDTKVGDLVLSAGANPDPDMFALLCDNDEDFERVWKHQKKCKDPSCSAYELSIATRAAQARWPKQEIANLLIAHRRHWEPNKIEKVLRPDYMRRTIEKAMKDGGLQAAFQSLSGIPDEDETDDASTAGAEKERTLLDLSNVFGVKIAGILQIGRADAVYALQLVDGSEVEIGSTRQMLKSCVACIDAIESRCDVTMRPVAKEDWPNVTAAMTKSKTVSDPEGARPECVIRDAAETYLSRADASTREHKAEACAESAPMVFGGNVYINTTMFLKWLNVRGVDRWDRKKMLDAMRVAGFVSDVVTYRHPETKVSRRRAYQVIDEGKLNIEATPQGD